MAAQYADVELAWKCPTGRAAAEGTADRLLAAPVWRDRSIQTTVATSAETAGITRAIVLV